MRRKECLVREEERSTNDDRRVRVWEDGLTCIKFNLILVLSAFPLTPDGNRVQSPLPSHFDGFSRLSTTPFPTFSLLSWCNSVRALSPPFPKAGVRLVSCLCVEWAACESGNGINSFLLAVRSIVFVGASVLLLSFQYQLLPEPEIRREREIGVMRPTWIHGRSSRQENEERKKETSFLLTADHSFFSASDCTHTHT